MFGAIRRIISPSDLIDRICLGLMDGKALVLLSAHLQRSVLILRLSRVIQLHSNKRRESEAERR